MVLKCVIRYICAMNTAVIHNIVLLFIWIYFPIILIGYITYSSIWKPCILGEFCLPITRENLVYYWTPFNRLITVSRYNKIVQFFIKNELQCPYRKDVVMKPELMPQVTPLHVNNMTWYTHPTMTIVMLLCSYHIKNCDNQIICIQPNHNHKITIHS